MGLKEIIAIVGIVLLTLVGIALLQEIPDSASQEEEESSLSIITVNRSGNYSYTILSYSGKNTIVILTYSEKPVREIFVMREKGIGNEKFDDFFLKLSELQRYGYEIRPVSSDFRPVEGVVIVPTGAMPLTVLDALQYEDRNSTIIYFGAKNLVLSDGVSEQQWYSNLSEKHKQNLFVYEIMPDDYLPMLNSSFIASIAESNWTVKNRTVYSTEGRGIRTVYADASGAAYVRTISFSGNDTAVNDFEISPEAEVSFPLVDIMPWGTAAVNFSVSKSNGTVFFKIFKDGTEIESRPIRRVAEAQLFREDVQFNSSGDYVVALEDNRGVIGGGIVHVKDLRIEKISSSGRSFVFNITLDEEPLDEKVYLSLNSAERKHPYIINGGVLSFTASMPQGKNNLFLDIFEHTTEIEIENNYENIFDVYIKYGVPGIILVGVIFVLARISRRPVYHIRMSHVSKEVRKDMHMSKSQVLEVFKKTRDFLGIKGPITNQEFAVGLKKYFTEGAEVTEGNVQEILSKLCQSGDIEHHRDYYQMAKEGNSKTNVLLRICREKLIERGIEFSISGQIIKCRDFDIVAAPSSIPFSKRKSILLFEDEADISSFLSVFDKATLAKFEIMRSNEVLSLASIARLDEVL